MNLSAKLLTLANVEISFLTSITIITVWLILLTEAVVRWEFGASAHVILARALTLRLKVLMEWNYLILKKEALDVSFLQSLMLITSLLTSLKDALRKTKLF